MKTKLNLARYFAIVPLILMLSTGSLYAAKAVETQKVTQADLDAEIEDRIAGDDLLRSELATETLARETADTAESAAICQLFKPASTLDLPDFCFATHAIAYINVDDIGGYNPLVDVLIAELLDTDNSGIPSAGDTVDYGHYPLNFIPYADAENPQLGAFLVGSEPVTDVDVDTAGEIIVRTATGIVKFATLPHFDVLHIRDHQGANVLVMADTIFNENTASCVEEVPIDYLEAQSATTPPNASIDVLPVYDARISSCYTDNNFVNVDLY